MDFIPYTAAVGPSGSDSAPCEFPISPFFNFLNCFAQELEGKRQIFSSRTKAQTVGKL
jgi:hypothetical protein